MNYGAPALTPGTILYGNLAWMMWNLILACLPAAMAVVLFAKRRRIWMLLALLAVVVPLAAMVGFQIFIWATTPGTPDWTRKALLLVVPLAGVVACVIVDLIAVDRRELSPVWWAGVVGFVLLLPNAPYVLTDVIHFRDQWPLMPSALSRLALVTQYAVFVVVGWEAFCVSMLMLRSELVRRGLGRWSIAVEVVVCAACAVAISLGRVLRLNSWDAIVDPRSVVDGAGRLFASGPLAFTLVTFVIVAAGWFVSRGLHLGIVSGLRTFRMKLSDFPEGPAGLTVESLGISNS